MTRPWVRSFSLLAVAVVCLSPTLRSEWKRTDPAKTEWQRTDPANTGGDGLRYHRRRLLESNRHDFPDFVLQHLEFFARSPDAEVVGPSAFPKPSDKAKKSYDDEIVLKLKPAVGQHRPEKDAVLLLAAEYSIGIYVQFIESLLATGYDGDIVLSVHERDLERADIREYLEYNAEARGVVVYSPHQVCFTKEMEPVDSANGGGRKCKLHGIFGRKLANGSFELLEDPRGPRTVQNIRYETYWVMASVYNPDSWIFLVDSRDTVFQSNPFANVPRQTDPSGKSGVLYLFGENMDASRIGQSVKFNYRWIHAAYGMEVAQFLKEKPILCSGATMGEKAAVETYLRAMVAEADETGTVIMGSDQGFHNRLYYSNKLKNADQIHSIIVFDQGAGIVNNLAALRSKKLEEWGNGALVEVHDGQYIVKNWDGTLR